MPELPEVEHAARTLSRWLLGRRIRAAEAPESRVFRGGHRGRFLRDVPGRSLRSVERRGKILLLRFDRDVGVLSHLGMTGKWVKATRTEPPPRHVRASLHVAGGDVIHYDDPRLFGRIAVFSAAALSALPEVAGLGPDPLTDGLDPAALRARLARSRRPIKVALMEQAVIAGLGNIQAQESLFRARLSPHREARSLTLAEWKRLVKSIDTTIAETLAAQGPGDRITYVEEPGAENPFLVYGRAGEPCPRCRTPIVRDVHAGRSTASCPRCQPG